MREVDGKGDREVDGGKRSSEGGRRGKKRKK